MMKPVTPTGKSFKSRYLIDLLEHIYTYKTCSCMYIFASLIISLRIIHLFFCSIDLQFHVVLVITNQMIDFTFFLPRVSCDMNLIQDILSQWTLLFDFNFVAFFHFLCSLIDQAAYTC